MHETLVFAAAVIAGGINSVAGGGMLVSFPTLIWLGIPPITANATNTVAIWTGTLGSAWGYRRELRGVDPRVYALVVPSVDRQHRRGDPAVRTRRATSSIGSCRS